MKTMCVNGGKTIWVAGLWMAMAVMVTTGWGAGRAWAGEYYVADPKGPDGVTGEAEQDVAQPLAVRALGDINEDGVVSAQDKAQITKRLNGLPVGYADRSFDLDGDGEVNAQDKAVVTKVLNGLPVN